jgi:hypothetical protein
MDPAAGAAGTAGAADEEVEAVLEEALEDALMMRREILEKARGRPSIQRV